MILQNVVDSDIKTRRLMFIFCYRCLYHGTVPRNERNRDCRGFLTSGSGLVANQVTRQRRAESLCQFEDRTLFVDPVLRETRRERVIIL